MAKPISTKEHGIIDYAMVGTLTAVPRIFGWEDRVTNVLTASGLTMFGYSLLTRYQMGVIKLIPMKVHLILDGISASLVLATPLVLKRKQPGVIAGLIGIGALEMAVTLLTKTRPPLMVQMEPVIPDSVPEPVAGVINNGLAALRGR